MGCHWSPSEAVHLDADTPISEEGRPVLADSIISTVNGGYLILGATNGSDTAWATRVGADGATSWEYRYGPSKDSWTTTNFTTNQFESRFYGAVALQDESVILCGIERRNRDSIAFIVHLDAHGKALKSRNLAHSEQGLLNELKCVNWGGGVALVGNLARASGPIGWLVKLNSDGEQLWEKYDHRYGAVDLMSESEDQLFMIGFEGGPTQEIVRIDESGAVTARNSLIPDAESQFVRSTQHSAAVYVTGDTSSGETHVIELDANLATKNAVATFDGTFVKRAFRDANGTFTFFGSTRRRNTPTATITRLFKNGSWTAHPIEPLYQSPWFNDAALGSGASTFVAMRGMRGNSFISRFTIGPK